MKMYMRKHRLFAFVALFLLCVPVTSLAQETEVIDGVTYDIVTITVDAPSYDTTKPPVFAKVKYNKLCPLVITSDDMGAGELARNWAYFNGYPVYANDAYGQIFMGNDFLNSPYSASAWAQQVKGVKRESHQPLTYSDGAGGVCRFTGTSAIWPHFVDNTNATLINKNDAKVMIRTGWSFAQHDVDDTYTTDASTIAGRLKALSDDWASKVGIGLKVLVEPTGNHTYIDAGKQSDEICWDIFQNGDNAHPEMTNTLIDDWTKGKDWTTFGNNKPEKTTRRIFFQGHETEFTNAINNADGTKFIIGGTHGIGDDILSFTKELAIGGSHSKADQFWVAGADEVWEYYHLYNNAKITDVNFDATKKQLTFKVNVPKYKKNQFRELTINIPGITGGTNCTFSNNVITGGSKQNDGQYTINFGLEDKIKTYIDELITYYRAHQYNTYVKEDAQYLINRLLPGLRTGYQTRLDATPTYGTYSVKTSINDKTLTSGAQDAAATVTYTFPKYLLNGTDLYQANANAAQPLYVSSFTPNTGTDNRTVNYTKAIEGVTFFSEGEDLDGTHFNPKSMGNINDSGKGEYMPWHQASNGAGGYIDNNQRITVTQVQPGKYNLVVAVGDSYNNASNYATFTFKLGDKTIFSFRTDKQGIKEYTKEAIIVKETLTLTVEATGSGTSRWIDYLYLKKVAEYDATVPEVVLSATKNEIDVTNGISPVTITATATGYESTNIKEIVIKDADGIELKKSNNSTTCTFEYTPTQIGKISFSAEATDENNRTGLSEDFFITVKSDFTLTVKSNLGDDIGSVTFSGQTADKTYRFMYPRFLLKGTELYETEALSTNDRELHYGENIGFTLANNKVDKTVDYHLVSTNIIYYTEGENIEGARTWTWEGANLDYGKGETWALTLGSMGKCGAVTDVTVTTIPAGKYKIYAGFGTTNDATYTIKLGTETVDTYPTTSSNAINEYSYETNTLSESTQLNIHCNKGKDNSQNWIDYIYIQKLDAIPVSVTDAGYATFSSPYALDFTSSSIKAYTATVTDGKVMMSKVVGSVPAATGLFLQGAEGTKNIPLATSIPPTIENNALKPHLETGNVAAGNYVFSKDKSTGDLSFRKLSSDTEVPGGRAYLSVPSEARNLTIEIDDVTGIRLVPMEPTPLASPAYNLQGLPVSEHTKGIIIRNGRKYINTKKQ